MCWSVSLAKPLGTIPPIVHTGALTSHNSWGSGCTSWALRTSLLLVRVWVCVELCIRAHLTLITPWVVWCIVWALGTQLAPGAWVSMCCVVVVTVASVGGLSQSFGMLVGFFDQAVEHNHNNHVHRCTELA